MSIFPETIKIRIIDADAKCPIIGILIMLHVFANHKNDYFMIPAPSNNNGEMTVCKEWVSNQIEKERNLFIMDYISTIDDCKPFIKLEIMNNEATLRAIEGYKEWQTILKIPEEEIDNLKSAKNALYKPVSRLVKFDECDVIEVVIEVQKV